MTGVSRENSEELLLALKRLAPSRAESPTSYQNYMDARRAVSKAMTETTKYIVDHERQGKKNIQKQRELSQLWIEAEMAMRIFNHELANIFEIKSRGWIDERTWDSPEAARYDLSIANIAAELRKMRPPVHVPSWFSVAGAVFAAFTVISVFYLLIEEVPMDDQRRRIFDAWLAFCFAASTAFIGGTAAARGNLPLPQALGESPVRFAAGGGVAIFAIVFLVLRNA